jgi:hypothetical protein
MAAATRNASALALQFAIGSFLLFDSEYVVGVLLIAKRPLAISHQLLALPRNDWQPISPNAMDVGW